MSAFYKGIVYKIGDSFQIVYPMKGIESFLKRGSSEIENHLSKLIVNSDGFYDSLFQIIILWSDGKDIMTDIWLYKGIESEDTGYTIDCRTYRDFSEVHEAGISASDGIVLIGKETELAEDYRKEKKSIEDYIHGNRPNIGNSDVY